MVLILINIVGILPADLGIPAWLGGYVILTSSYSAVKPRQRVEERRQECCCLPVFLELLSRFLSLFMQVCFLLLRLKFYNETRTQKSAWARVADGT